MKILTVTYSGRISGGANPAMLNVLRDLKYKYGHDITVIVPYKGNLIDALNELNIRSIVKPFSLFTCYRGNTINGYLKYIWMYVRSLKVYLSAIKTAKEFRHENFDVVYTNEFMCFYGAFIARILGVPHVWHFRSESSNAWMPFFSKNIYNSTEGRIIAISKYIYNFVTIHLGIEDKCVLIHDGVETQNTISYKYTKGDIFHLLLAGRINPMKQQVVAIKALGILQHRGYTDIVLHLAGSLDSAHNQSYYDSLIDLIKKYDLEKNLIWEGQVKDMMALRATMNVELMCSKNEPFGLVTVEGMRAGLVVIGSDSGGTIDIIKDGYNGLLFKTGDANDLADKIESVYKDEQLARQLSLNAYEFSQTHFTVEQNSAEVNKVIESVVKR